MTLRPIHEPRDLSRPIRALGAFLSLFLLGIAAVSINLLQVASLVVWPFSPVAFRRLNRGIAFVWWRFCLFLTERVYRLEVVYSGDALPAGENALLVSNHQCMPDILCLMPLAHRCGRLADLKWFVKDALKYLPGIGWGMLFLDCVYLKRNWNADARRVRATFSNLVKHGLPFWLVSFSEGTRVTRRKREQSQEFARQTGRPVLHNVLLPRTRGFTASIEGLRGRLDAVYDVTLAFEPGVPSLWQFYKGRLRRVHVDVRRFPMSELPSGENELAEWLVRRFIAKDAALERFFSSGSLAG